MPDIKARTTQDRYKSQNLNTFELSGALKVKRSLLFPKLLIQRFLMQSYLVRRSLLFAAAPLCGVFLAGCFQITQEIDLQDGENAFVTTRLEVDEVFVGGELDLFFDSLALSVPALTVDAVHYRGEAVRDFESFRVYVWEGNKPSSGDFTLVRQGDGSFEFRYPLPALDSLSNHLEDSSVLFVVTAKLPLPVDFANTREIDGHAVTWRLTKQELQNGVTLRAFTVAP